MVEPAKILASKVLRTNIHHRPYPSLFYFPGLNSLPYHNTSNFPFVKDFEKNLSTIKKEYKALK